MGKIFDINHRENLFIIGLMGGIASGKSVIAKILGDLGAYVISADPIVHEILKQTNIQQQIESLWGDRCTTNGALDRKKLAQIVFSSPADLSQLEKIVHPCVYKEIKTRLEQLANSKNKVVLDIPLLWENDLYQGCDILLFIDVPLKVRQKRVLENRNWSSDELTKRESFQTQLEIKKNAAHFVISNEDKEKAHRQICEIWKAVK